MEKYCSSCGGKLDEKGLCQNCVKESSKEEIKNKKINIVDKFRQKKGLYSSLIILFLFIISVGSYFVYNKLKVRTPIDGTWVIDMSNPDMREEFSKNSEGKSVAEMFYITVKEGKIYEPIHTIMTNEDDEPILKENFTMYKNIYRSQEELNVYATEDYFKGLQEFLDKKSGEEFKVDTSDVGITTSVDLSENEELTEVVNGKNNKELLKDYSDLVYSTVKERVEDGQTIGDANNEAPSDKEIEKYLSHFKLKNEQVVYDFKYDDVHPFFEYMIPGKYSMSNWNTIYNNIQSVSVIVQESEDKLVYYSALDDYNNKEYGIVMRRK